MAFLQHSKRPKLMHMQQHNKHSQSVIKIGGECRGWGGAGWKHKLAIFNQPRWNIHRLVIRSSKFRWGKFNVCPVKVHSQFEISSARLHWNSPLHLRSEDRRRCSEIRLEHIYISTRPNNLQSKTKKQANWRWINGLEYLQLIYNTATVNTP